MIPISSSARIWIATGYTDMRKGMQGLSLLVQGLGRDPFAGDVFVFRGGNSVFKRYRDRAKADVFTRLLKVWSDAPDMEYAPATLRVLRQSFASFIARLTAKRRCCRSADYLLIVDLDAVIKCHDTQHRPDNANAQDNKDQSQPVRHFTNIVLSKRNLKFSRGLCVVRRSRRPQRGGPGCLNRFSASISGASAKVRPPSGVAAG